MVVASRPGRNRRPQAAGDRSLVEAAQADVSKFDAIYERHFELVYFFILGRVHDRAIAEDLTSETFHKALANLSSYQPGDTPFAAWLYRIAANAMADQYKRANRERRGAVAMLEPAAQPASTPQEMEYVERRTLLSRLIEKLPEMQRRIIQERFIEERSVKEIASRLEKSEGAVKQLQFRALRTLRERIGERHG
ncbi:MAG: sigma-70 family RNA polymerase sigma factor [Acidobacteriaceae bacterium]|nr:sigma-70 family RNA polymerase sigma factor [Acidobacteriaceae bacterium]